MTGNREPWAVSYGLRLLAFGGVVCRTASLGTRPIGFGGLECGDVDVPATAVLELGGTAAGTRGIVVVTCGRRLLMGADDTLLAAIPGAEHSELGGVQLDIVRTGKARVKRSIYPVGFHWASHIKPHVGTELCMHCHVGFLARGRIHMTFADGCTRDFVAPQVVVIEAGHDGRVVGDEPAVLIEFDFEGETAARLGLAEQHRH